MIFTAVAVAAVLATACTKESAPATTGNAIEFRSLLDKNANSRASLVENIGEFTSFFVAAGLNVQNEQNEYELGFMQSPVWRTRDEQDGSIFWNYSPKKYYPADGTAINFFAYAPIKDVNMDNYAKLHIDPNDADEVWFEYTVPKEQSKSNTAVDLLVASVLGAVSGEVELDFKHALSAVTFSAANTNPTGSELVYVIHGIEITALDNEGTFTYPLTWTPLGNITPENYKAGIPKSGVALMNPDPDPDPDHGYENLLSANDIMMVLPQSPQTKSAPPSDTDPGDTQTYAYVKITFSVKDGSGNFIYENHKRYLPLPETFIFKPETFYNFQFRFEALDAISFSVKFEPWSMQEVSLSPTNP